MSVSKPHSGHLDAELNKPEELTNQRLTDIACQCLQRWDSYPTLPGSRRWSVNGRTALRELERRLGNLEEQLQSAQAETRAEWQRAENLRFELSSANEQLQAAHKRIDQLVPLGYQGLLGVYEQSMAGLEEQLESVSAEAHKRGQDTYAARALLAEGRGAVRRAGFGPPSELAGWAAAVDAMLGDSYPASEPKS